MTETRKIIGVIDELNLKKDVVFPSVRVWIKGQNEYEIRGLKKLFPDRGTVFLHISKCEGQHPLRNQVGLFNCVQSPPGEKAEWEVSFTSKHLAQVFDYPSWSAKHAPLAFCEWLATYKVAATCSILLGDDTAYVRRGKLDLVGPFVISPEGKLICREQTFLSTDVELLAVDISGNRYELIDTELLSKEKPIILDPSAAIHRRLKLAHKASQLDWLSRTKMQELTNALASVLIADGSEWVMDCIPRALELACTPGNIDSKLVEVILQIKAVEDAIEMAWKKKHTDAVKNAESEIEKLKHTAAGIKKSIEGLNEELVRMQKEKVSLESVLAELTKKIDVAKGDAQKVFDAELKRLAQSPASMALLAAWSGGGNTTMDRSQPLIKIQHAMPDCQQAADLKVALFNNLKTCSLLPSIANELEAVCRAALAAGQPITIRSLFADLLAEGIASALGQPTTVWADMPAGLLDPLDWDQIIPSDQKGNPIILQNANRSDIPLALGTLRPSLLRQALGYQQPDGVLLLTLEANIEMQVQSDFPLGPLIDDSVLRFNPAKTAGAMSASTDFTKHLPEVMAVSAEEFAEISDNLRRLPLFVLSAHEMAFRRAYGALRATWENHADLPRLFFKYWCLPRLSSGDVKNVLEAHKESWKQDKSLVELREALDRNG
jgi:hypothetical protein